MQNLDCIEHNPKQKAEACIIWLHGLGADADDFLPLVEELKLPNKANIKFVFPSAPIRSITINNGISMRGWFDALSLDFTNQEDDFGIKQSNTLISRLLDKEISNGIKSDKIIIGGFSQGGAMSLHAGLRYPKPLGGIVAFSAYCPRSHTIKAEANKKNLNTPIFLTHGLFDPMIPLHIGQKANEVLTKLKYQTRFKTYPIQHMVSAEEITDLSSELSKMLKLESVK